MAPPPAKKRRLVSYSSRKVVDSDDESPTSTEQSAASSQSTVTNRKIDALPMRTPPKTKTTKSTAAKRKIAIPKKPIPQAPQNGTLKSKNGAQKSCKSSSIYSFFDAVPPSQKADGSTKESAVEIETEEEDNIEDSSSDIGSFGVGSIDNNVMPLDRVKHDITHNQKRSRKAPVFSGKPVSNGKLPGPSQKFKSTAEASQLATSSKATQTEDLRPWAEKYGPANISELAVHKKKIADVEKWLNYSFNGRGRQKILVLKGPAGSGKTATIQLLAKSIDADLIEWKNPTISDYESEAFVPVSAQFEEFLGRSDKFGSLEVEDTNILQKVEEAPEENDRRKILIMEEFPSTFRRDLIGLRAFRSNLLQYLAILNLLPGGQSKTTPLIMIISETHLTSSTTAEDSFTAHRLLGPEILSHPAVNVVEFNPIAPTFLAKALDLVIQKEARQSGKRKSPGNAVLQRLGEVGDIRSAIGSLQFLAVKGANDIKKSSATRTKGSKTTPTLTKLEQETLEMVTQREASLGIFHAVGRVVYNKREDPSIAEIGNEQHLPPPDHLSHHARPLVSQVSVENLMDETGTDTLTFVAALHENYVLSCNGATFTDSMNGCIQSLSDSDLLTLHEFETGGSVNAARNSAKAAVSDSLRQDEICFQVAVRGLLFALPYPVKRTAASNGVSIGKSARGDGYKMLYPTSAKLWRHTQEIRALIDQWTGNSLNPQGHRAATASVIDSAERGVESWANNFFQSFGGGSYAVLDKDAAATLLLGGNSARTEMILERLPYLAKMQQRTQNSCRARELERMTQFKGLDLQNEDASDDEEFDVKAPVTSMGPPPKSFKGPGRSKRDNDAAIPMVAAVRNLVLSDDDIED
ncbi:MAG: Cell cycle checkpoint protein rad17 [Icmadophila ericetorum]|nr:Cell cycle checkpoint protein rad17 [Icmadophila ericetorum]